MAAAGGTYVKDILRGILLTDDYLLERKKQAGWEQLGLHNAEGQQADLRMEARRLQEFVDLEKLMHNCMAPDPRLTPPLYRKVVKLLPSVGIDSTTTMLTVAECLLSLGDDCYVAIVRVDAIIRPEDGQPDLFWANVMVRHQIMAVGGVANGLMLEWALSISDLLELARREVIGTTVMFKSADTLIQECTARYSTPTKPKDALIKVNDALLPRTNASCPSVQRVSYDTPLLDCLNRLNHTSVNQLFLDNLHQHQTRVVTAGDVLRVVLKV
eukprot:jgi/Chlat1/6849/Chrsp51S06567